MKNTALTCNLAAYNKWHETELERWLSDHDIPYPTPADRKDLEKVIQENWDTYAVSPYKNWDTDSLSAYLKARGVEAQKATADNKDALISQVQTNWYETEDKAQTAWSNARDWILDTWTDSSLKAFCDKNNIPGTSLALVTWLLARLKLTHDIQSLNPATVTPSSRKPAPTMKLSPRRLARLPRIRATGFTSPGASLTSRSGSIPMAFPLLSPPL